MGCLLVLPAWERLQDPSPVSSSHGNPLQTASTSLLFEKAQLYFAASVTEQGSLAFITLIYDFPCH